MAFTLTTKTDEASRARVFIGNLPNEQVTKESMRQVFSQFGTYLDCSIFKNYGFVQFADERSALNAVKGIHGTMMHDRKLDVKIAVYGPKKSDNFNKSQSQENFNPTKRSNSYDVKPLMAQQTQDPNAYGDHRPSIKKPPHSGPPPHGQNRNPQTVYRPRGPKPSQHSNHDGYEQTNSYPPQQHAQPQNPYNQGYPQSQPYQQFNPYYSQNNGAPQYQATPTQPAPDTASQKPFAPNKQTQPFPAAQTKSDSGKLCDIICCSKKLFQYAEYIESSACKIGYVCNINVISKDYPADGLLKRCARDATIAITLRDENESHHSLTMNTFGAEPQEHRDMPFNIAETLMKKKFSEVPAAPNSQIAGQNFNYSIPASYVNNTAVSQPQSYSTSNTAAAGVAGALAYGYTNPAAYASQYYQNYGAPAVDQATANAYYQMGAAYSALQPQSYYPQTSTYGAAVAQQPATAQYKRT